MVCARVWVGRTHVFQRTWAPPGPHRPTGGVVDFPPRRAARHYSPSSRTSAFVAPLTWYNCYSSKGKAETGQPSAEQPQSRSMWCFNWVLGTFLFAHVNFKIAKVQADEILCFSLLWRYLRLHCGIPKSRRQTSPILEPNCRGRWPLQVCETQILSFGSARISTLFSFSTISFSSLGSSTFTFSTLVLTLKTCGPPST